MLNIGSISNRPKANRVNTRKPVIKSNTPTSISPSISSQFGALSSGSVNNPTVQSSSLTPTTQNPVNVGPSYNLLGNNTGVTGKVNTSSVGGINLGAIRDTGWKTPLNYSNTAGLDTLSPLSRKNQEDMMTYSSWLNRPNKNLFRL